MNKYASVVIAMAMAEVGYLEKASRVNLDNKTANAGSKNYTKYARDLDAIPGFYNAKKQGYAWCDIFVDWCFVQSFGPIVGKELLCATGKVYGAGCGMSARYYKDKGQYHTSDPKPGDQIFFWNAAKNKVAHTGLVYKVDSKKVYTIEGNTSGTSGVVANGGGVFKKSYKLNYSRICGYGRPAYDEEPKKEPEDKPAFTVLEWQKAAIADGFKFPKYGADGEWGAECESVARKAICKRRITYKYKNLTRLVQKAVGASVDGKFGKKTKEAVIDYQERNGLDADGEVGLNTWKKMLEVSDAAARATVSTSTGTT